MNAEFKMQNAELTWDCLFNTLNCIIIKKCRGRCRHTPLQIFDFIHRFVLKKQPHVFKGMIFMTYPNLPNDTVKVFIADCDIPGCTVIPPFELSILPKGLRRHADMGICFVSSKKAVCPPESCVYYRNELLPYGIEVIEGKTKIGSNYPHDCAYNVGIVGKKCFLNKNVCDVTLLDILTSEGFEILHVKQGYSKCSICPIDENTFITADKGIASTGKNAGMEVLLITNEGILLEGYENGFWGGSCGLGAPDILLVNGEISTIPSGKEIEAFLFQKGIKIKNLKKGEIIDIGSILPLMYKS